jgi:hypothetical protein
LKGKGKEEEGEQKELLNFLHRGGNRDGRKGKRDRGGSR